MAEPRIGSDHVPLVLSSGEESKRRSRRFFFETAWFEHEGFGQLVLNRWSLIGNQVGRQRGPVEFWSSAAAALRAFLRGWGANHGSESKRLRERIVDEIALLDAQADVRSFSGDEWEYRYSLENQVLAILREEEEYWRQRGTFNWDLFGDANTSYFQAIANGRRRRCTIPLLWDEGNLIQDPGELKDLVDGFYRDLFAARPHGGTALAKTIWRGAQLVSIVENDLLLVPFD